MLLDLSFLMWMDLCIIFDGGKMNYKIYINNFEDLKEIIVVLIVVFLLVGCL